MNLDGKLQEAPMKEARWEMVYSKINGQYKSDVCPDVRNECGEGGILGQMIQQVYQTRDHIADRLGVDPSLDKDLDQLIGGMEDFARACGKLMYRYGYQDGTKGL